MDGFALLNYNIAAAGVNAVNSDLTAAVDPDFSQRSGHYIFTERYWLRSIMPLGVSLTRGRIQIPHINAIGEAQIFAVNRSLQVPSNPQQDLYFDMPVEIPQNEELQIQLSNNLGAATEIENCAILLTGQNWSANIPPAMAFGTEIVRASFTVTPTLNAWSGGQNLTFSAAQRGGTYSVVGATLQGTNAAFFRIIFPKYNLYNGRRKLRPGYFVQTAIGDVLSNQLDPWVLQMGEWGRYDTFEPPTVEVFGTVAGSITYQLFLWVRYISETTMQGGVLGGP